MDKNDNLVDITNDLRKAERKMKWKKRVKAAKDWAYENRQTLAVAIPAVATAIGGIIKVAGRRANIMTEERNKDRRCYDARLGHYWQLRRKLSNSEWLSIDQRMARGERLSDILDDLGVLK